MAMLMVYWGIDKAIDTRPVFAVSDNRRIGLMVCERRELTYITT